MYMDVLPVCTCLYLTFVPGAWFPQRPEEGVGSPGTGVTDGCQLPCGFWESNPDPQKEQPVLLTAGPSLHPVV